MKLVLIGFMATGKSIVAPTLAGKLGLDVVEMDDLIVEKSSFTSITEIFEIGGEAAFRKLEKEVSKDLQRRKNVVISTGGGVVMDKTVMRCLADKALVIELLSTFETILKRVSPGIPRPLFKDKQAPKQLYELRKPLYNKYAEIHIATDDRSINGVADEIVKRIKTYEHHS